MGACSRAVGIALPETTISIWASAWFLSPEDPEVSSEVRIEAILGAPFLLATLAMFVVGVAGLGFRRRRRNGAELVIYKKTAIRDVAFFVCLAVAVGVVTLLLLLKVVLAVSLVGAYFFHIVRMEGREEVPEEVPEKLTLWPPQRRALVWAVVAQVLGDWQ